MKYTQNMVIHRAYIGVPVDKSLWGFKHWGIPKTHQKARGSNVQCSVGEIEFYYKEVLVKTQYVTKREEREKFMAKCLKGCKNLSGQKHFVWKPKTRNDARKYEPRYKTQREKSRLDMLAKVRGKVYSMSAGDCFFTEMPKNEKNYGALWRMARRASEYSNGARTYKTTYETMSIERLT